MSELNNHIDELIGKYLSGEASQAERAEVDAWRAVGESNEKYFSQLALIFNKTPEVKTQQVYDSDAAWLKLKERIDSKKGKVVTLNPSDNRQLYLKIAASIIFVITAGYLAYQYFNLPTSSVEVITSNKPETDTLPDGSDVVLNKATQLTYTFDRRQQAHVVKLKGEAYFNINHNDDKKFIVDAGGVFIRDIGTSFNVKAYPDSTLIEVMVEEGEVMFFSENDSGLYLKKGGRGIYNKVTKKFTIADPDPNLAAYATKFFSFTDVDLATIVKTINNVYDKKINIASHLHACRLTVSFNNESPDEIADIIAETLDLQKTVKGDTIHLDGNACSSK